MAQQATIESDVKVAKVRCYHKNSRIAKMLCSIISERLSYRQIIINW